MEPPRELLLSKVNVQRIMVKMKNHKLNCLCGVCKSIRGETLGSNNPCFRGGVTLKKYQCKICNKEISTKTALYGRGYCRNCGNRTKEARNKMSLAKIGHTTWNKGLTGFKGYWTGKSNKDIIVKHHIDSDKTNNKESNFLKITQGRHRSLHWRGYEYLVKIGKIYDYLKDFFLKYEIVDTKINDGKVVHHIDCNRENNHSNNLLYLKDKKIHNKLHQETYKYLVRINMVNDYISWFLLNEEEKLPKTETIEELK